MADETEMEVVVEEDGGEVDKIKKLREQLKQCQRERQDNLVGWQRAQADFINYRRRQEEQMGEWAKMFGEGLLRDILPVMDALDASIGNSGEKEREGLRIIREQLMKILGRHGLTEIKTIGEKFDHNLHEAMEAIDSENENGRIEEEIQKGYLLNGRAIRIAKVKVSK